MIDILDALKDPFAWTPVPPKVLSRPWWRRLLGGKPPVDPEPNMLMTHPSGHLIQIKTYEDQTGFLMGVEWGIIHSPGTTQEKAIGWFKKTTDAFTLENFQLDLDRAYGNDARTRLETFKQHVRLLCIQRGIHDDVHFSRDRIHGPKVWIPNGILALPPVLELEMFCCLHILHVMEESRILHYAAYIEIDMMATGHERMSIMQQATEAAA